MQQCYGNCKNFSVNHRSKYIHPPRERKCKYFPCILLHDHAHLINFTHKDQYEIISKNNSLYNSLHSLYISDIWYNIHNFVGNSTYVQILTLNYTYHSDMRIQTVNKLLCTSKIFNILLNTKLSHVNMWKFHKGVYIYDYDERYDKCLDCGNLNIFCKCDIKCPKCNINFIEHKKNINSYKYKYDDNY